MTNQINQAVFKEFNGMQAAADFLGNGAIYTPMFEREIVDLVSRESMMLQRVDHPPATGHPHRYFEQSAIATAAFTDPQNLSPTPTSPARAEKAAFIKAIINQTNFSLFDVHVTRQQGVYTNLKAKDIQDLLVSCAVLSAKSCWIGTDTSLSTPTTNQYMGLLRQITNTGTIDKDSSIIDGLKAFVAAMVANTSYTVRPTGIYLNPILANYIAQEAKATNYHFDKVEVVAGVKVNGLQTEAGILPLVSDSYIPSVTSAQYGFSAPTATYKNYFAAILTEPMIEMPYINPEGSWHPQLYELGLVSNLNNQYVAVQFDCIIAKGASYAHTLVAVERK